MKNPTLWASSQVLLLGLGFPIAWVICICLGRTEFCLSLRLLPTKWRLRSANLPRPCPWGLWKGRSLGGGTLFGDLDSWGDDTQLGWIAGEGEALWWRGDWIRLILAKIPGWRGVGTIDLEKIRTLGLKGPSCSSRLARHCAGLLKQWLLLALLWVTLQSLTLLLLWLTYLPGSSVHLSGQAGQWPMTSTNPSPPNCSGHSPLLLFAV